MSRIEILDLLRIFAMVGLAYSIYKLREINKIMTKHYTKPNIGRGVITRNFEASCPYCHVFFKIGITDKGDLAHLCTKEKYDNRTNHFKRNKKKEN